MVVNTVSNNNVSVENDTFVELSVVISSLRQEAMSSTTAANRKKKRLFFMRQRWFKERVFARDIASKREEKLREVKSGEEIIPRSGYIPLGLVLKGFVHKVDQLIFVPVESTKTLYCFPRNNTLNVKLFHCEGKVALNTNSPFFTRIPPNPMVIAIQVPAIEVM